MLKYKAQSNKLFRKKPKPTIKEFNRSNGFMKNESNIFNNKRLIIRIMYIEVSRFSLCNNIDGNTESISLIKGMDNILTL